MSWWTSMLATNRKRDEVRTARLRLVPATREMLEAELSGSGRLSDLLKARVTAEWPPEPWRSPLLDEVLERIPEPRALGPLLRYVLLCDAKPARRVLVGALGAFPRQGGDVEIAYATLPEFQRQGFGTEAVGAFVEHLLAQPVVRSVSAQAMVATPESIKVMERCGMSLAGAGDEDGTVRYRRVR